MTASYVFMATTAALWLIGVWRMGFRRYSHKLNSFFLGMTVMSFASIWITLIDHHP